MQRTARALTAVVAWLLCPMSWAQAPAFPNKPVRMIVTAAPGGLTDIMARILAEHFGRTAAQTMIVENKPGAGGNIAIEFVVRSPADGYTLVIVNVGTIAVQPWIDRNMPFDPLGDLVPVAPVVDGASIIAINARLPAHSLQELIEHARAAPGRLNFASAGNGTMPHLAAELFAFMTGLKLVHVPYKGGGPAAVDLGTGQVQLSFLGLGSIRAQLAAGQVRAIAVGTKQRLAALPDVPTFEEAGLSGYDVTNWFGVFAPKGTPREVVARLNELIGRMHDDAAVVKRLQGGGMVPMRESPEGFQQRILADSEKWRDVVRRAGIIAQ